MSALYHISPLPGFGKKHNANMIIQVPIVLVSKQLFPMVEMPKRIVLPTTTTHRDLAIANVLDPLTKKIKFVLASVQLDPPPSSNSTSSMNKQSSSTLRIAGRGKRKIRQVQLNQINEYLRSSPNAIVAGNVEFSDNSAPERDLPKHFSQDFCDVFARERMIKGTLQSRLATCGTLRVDRIFLKSQDQSLQVMGPPETLTWMGSRRMKDRLEMDVLRKMDCGKKDEALELLKRIETIPEPFGIHNGLKIYLHLHHQSISSSHHVQSSYRQNRQMVSRG